MTAIDIVNDMGLGTNLGNTFDAWNTGGTVETAWGNAITTKAMIDEIHNYGFDSIRIPVTWYEHMNASTYEIDDDYIARLKEVIGYCYDNDMYVIIDMHWDWVSDGSLWLNKGISAVTQFRGMWTDIAENFIDYDQHLVFQSMNEVRWTSGAGSTYTDNDYSVLNSLNAAFVDVVRSTGGNNEDRLLLLAGADANLTNTLNSKYEVPDDDMVAVDIHYYNPSTFCVAETDSTWGYTSTWGTAAEQSDL
ncbi:MAG: glycoside hydrolase family 5 protein, partial [Ruminococcus sp.]|nr:glycoside hydrolase family 5 protein [Ruminococcus sp.]